MPKSKLVEKVDIILGAVIGGLIAGNVGFFYVFKMVYSSSVTQKMSMARGTVAPEPITNDAIIVGMCFWIIVGAMFGGFIMAISQRYIEWFRAEMGSVSGGVISGGLYGAVGGGILSMLIYLISSGFSGLIIISGLNGVFMGAIFGAFLGFMLMVIGKLEGQSNS